MKWVRRFHLYLSVFFTPILVFFIATGWYQTLVPQRNKGLGEEGNWITNLRSVHVDQVYPNPKVEEYSPTLFKGFVVLMSFCLLVTIGLGIFLAFRTSKKQWPVWLSLLAGVLLPVIILWLGQRR